MTFATVKQVLEAMPGEEAAVRGWIYRARSSGAIVFAVVRDPSGIIQVTVKKGSLSEGDFGGRPLRHRGIIGGGEGNDAQG